MGQVILLMGTCVSWRLALDGKRHIRRLDLLQAFCYVGSLGMKANQFGTAGCHHPGHLRLDGNGGAYHDHLISIRYAIAIIQAAAALTAAAVICHACH